jgi:hypothetical protein
VIIRDQRLKQYRAGPRPEAELGHRAARAMTEEK